MSPPAPRFRSPRDRPGPRAIPVIDALVEDSGMTPYPLQRFVRLIALLALLGVSARPALAEKGVIYNPIKSRGQDPSVVYANGFYYLVQSENGDKELYVYKSPTRSGLASGTRVRVWAGAASGADCCELWAPELQLIDGKWYIYYAADDGNNANHRMYVLEGTSSDPQGSYVSRGKIAAPTDRWAIDGMVLQRGASLYFLWSGWAGTVNTQQNLYIAPMSNPWTISGERGLISEPTELWERRGGDGVSWPYINEAPQVLQRNGKVFVVYSASGSWTDDYCLGMLTASAGADLLQRSAWTKSNGCVFAKTTSAYGPGHNSFTTSPDHSEDWLAYHANTTAGAGWSGRSLRIQRFTWDASGNPVFGTPVRANVAIAGPSGERYEAENAVINRATVRTACCGASNGKVVGYIDFADSYVSFNNLYVPSAGTYALSVRFANGSGASSTHNLSVNGGPSAAITYPHTGWDNWTTTTINVNLAAGNNTLRFAKGNLYAELDYIDLPRYEAEHALVNHAVVRGACCGASNGSVVGYIDDSDSFVEFDTINVPSAGTYTLRVRFANGSGASSTHSVSVNGGPSTAITYPNTGWDNWSTVAISVNLAAGNNTIRFARGTLYAELDCIEVYR
jgi:GH43 family beta-xylosidase